MSYAENPESNPYAAPTSKIEASEFDQPTGYTGYSGFWRRFAAIFIDSIIMGFVGGILGAMVGAAVGKNADNQMGVMILLQVLSLAISVAYYAGMESSSSQATLGKMAMGIKVTDLYGRRVSFGRAAGRFFGKIISGLILGIGYFMAAFTEKKQALHDMMAGTLVLKTR